MSRKRLVLILVGLAAAVGLLAVLLPKRSPPQAPTEFVPDAWQAARTSPMHQVHLRKGKVTCVECHGGAPPKDGGAEDGGGPPPLGPDASLGDIEAHKGFDPRPGEKSCAGCHEKPAARAHVGSEATKTTCLTCHVFRGGATAATCVSCHAGEGAKRANIAPLAQHVEKGATCQTCHDLHAEKGKRAVLPDCTSCHTNVGARHARQIAAAPTQGDPKVTVELDAGVAVALRKSADHGAGSTCGTCHAPHQPAARAKEACISCHVEGGPKVSGLLASATEPPHVTPHGAKTAGHDACTTCHTPHDVRKDGVKFCASCHGDKQGALEVSKGHPSCRSCHAPHAPTEARSSCQSCHKSKETLGAAKVAAHAVCSNCHAPHDPKASPADACATCHKIAPQHPGAKTKKGGVGACIGCHAPHPGAGKALANIASAPLSATTASCASCHDGMQGKKSGHGKHGKGVECAQCHQPHAFKLAREGVAGAAVCARCHAPVAKAVAASPTPASKGHAACAACHGEPHSPTRSPSCASCHNAEVSTAPKGHQACSNCHEPHTGTFTQKGAVCTNCHEAKKSALHGNIGSGCATCHRPHGPKGVATPPSCAACHDKTKLPGLHSVDAHAQNCASCHGSHAPPRSDRATCTTGCHTDKRGHQPEAAVCKGCHIFRK